MNNPEWELIVLSGVIGFIVLVMVIFIAYKCHKLKTRPMQVTNYAKQEMYDLI